MKATEVKKQCLKVKHESKELALKAVEDMLNRTGYINRVYRCYICGFYHIGRPAYRRDPYAYIQNLKLSDKIKKGYMI